VCGGQGQNSTVEDGKKKKKGVDDFPSGRGTEEACRRKSSCIGEKGGRRRAIKGECSSHEEGHGEGRRGGKANPEGKN